MSGVYMNKGEILGSLSKSLSNFVDHFRELVVEVTGLGLLNWLVSKIATWVVGLTRDKVLDDLQKKYDAYIKSILSGYTIDDITSGKAFE